MMPREDVLVSVCLAELPRGTEAKRRLAEFASVMKASFAYFELVATICDGELHDISQVIAEVPNLRLLDVSPSHSEYRRRVIAATEAIGDIIIILDVEELALLDPFEMIAQAEASGKIVYALKPGQNVLNPLVCLLGRASDLSVSLNHLRSIAFPRNLLNRSLRRADKSLALRFPPASRMSAIQMPCGDAARARRRSGSTRQRITLIHTLMVNSAPSVLTVVSVISGGIILLAIALLAYSTATYAVHDAVEPGWLSTMVMLSVFSALLGTALFGISSGLQKAIDLLTPEAGNDVLGEKSSVDLFSAATRHLNVEVDSGAEGATEGRPASPGPDRPKEVA